MRVYLAGPIHGCTDEEVSGWRNAITNELRGVAECVDPTQWDFRGREDENYREIVNRDKDAINRCHALIANVWRVTAGTSMEILLAYELRIPCIVIAPPIVSPWIRYHATKVVATPHAAVAEIIRMNGTKQRLCSYCESRTATGVDEDSDPTCEECANG